MALLDLSGRGALVLGGGKGIGRATALTLGAAGAHTVVLDRHLDRATHVAAEIVDAGGKSGFVCADVLNGDEVDALIDAADRAAGGLDIVVNILGSASWRPLVAMEDDCWARDLRCNLEHHLIVGRSAVRSWIARGQPGVICVVASISGLFSSAGHAAYGAAKAGLLSFVRSAAEEWWGHGIRVNAVVPGAVRTPRIEATFPARGDQQPPSEILERMAAPEDVAGPIAFLVSDLAGRITGQALVIDGGTTTRFPYRLS